MLTGGTVPRSIVASIFALCALEGCSSDPDLPDRVEEIDPLIVPDCDPEVKIAPESRALMVTDPDALAELPLNDVFSHLLWMFGDLSTSPEELLQRLFDTSNEDGSIVFPEGIHCDSPLNEAHKNGPAAQCPREERLLAVSKGLLTRDDPDYFYPVAAVNRIDLMPFSATTCGEYRLVYAKKSGLSNPDDRVFLIFEMALPNPRPGDIFACRPVAEFWRSLESEPSPKAVGEKLRSFFFDGLPKFGPMIDPARLGLGSKGGGAYYDPEPVIGNGIGQLRVSQHMDEHWEMRQMVAATRDFAHLRFEPILVGNNPRPEWFSEAVIFPEDTFIKDFVDGSVELLASRTIEQLSMKVGPQYLSGESELGGDAINDYAARGALNQNLQDRITESIHQHQLGSGCPDDDPLTADSILRRATVQSCAGCHAPAQFLGPERKLGCGLTFPESLGAVHIDENGKRSPALEQVFLPHRAEVMTTYLQACDQEAIDAAFAAPSAGGTTTKSLNRNRTIGGGATH
jgi:hypothetical protein